MKHGTRRGKKNEQVKKSKPQPNKILKRSAAGGGNSMGGNPEKKGE